MKDHASEATTIVALHPQTLCDSFPPHPAIGMGKMRSKAFRFELAFLGNLDSAWQAFGA